MHAEVFVVAAEGDIIGQMLARGIEYQWEVLLYLGHLVHQIFGGHTHTQTYRLAFVPDGVFL